MKPIGSLLLVLVVGLQGCVSVPLATMVRMASFDDQDVAALDPKVIRARIKLEDSFRLDAERSALGVKITSPAGVHHGAFKLEKVSETRAELSKGVFSRNVAGTEYTLKLSEPSQEEFRKLQGFIRTGRPGEAVISIVPILSAFPEDADHATIWVDLLLSRDDGYFALLEAAEVPMAGIRAANAGSEARH